MSDHGDEARELAERAAGLPHGPAKVALLEEAVGVADAARDEDLGFALRSDAVGEMYEGNRPDLVLVHYAWCLAYLDRRPDVDPFATLWGYRWVVDGMPNFSAFPRAQIDAAWADMRARYEAGGWSLRPVWLNRRLHLAALGDAAGAADAQRRFTRARADFLSDSPEQDASSAVGYQVFLRRDGRAVAAAEAYLAAGHRSVTLTLNVLNKSLLPLARAGRVGDAAGFRRRADRLAAGRPEHHGRGGEALTFLAAVGDLAAAVRHFDRHFPAAHNHPGDLSRIPTYTHALFFARELVRRNKAPALKVPDGLVPGVTGTRTPPGPLRDWLEVALPELCARADARNGNGYHTDRLGELDEYARLGRTLG